MATSPKLVELEAYLAKLGVARGDFLSDARRPLILRIGTAEYVIQEEAAFFEAQVTARAHYARAGIPEQLMPSAPDLRPEPLFEGESAA